MLWIITTNFKVHDPKEGREEIESSGALLLPYILYFFFFNDNLVVLTLHKKVDFKAQRSLKNALKVGGLTCVWSTSVTVFILELGFLHR